jgi:hypothetical protein
LDSTFKWRASGARYELLFERNVHDQVLELYSYSPELNKEPLMSRNRFVYFVFVASVSASASAAADTSKQPTSIVNGVAIEGTSKAISRVVATSGAPYTNFCQKRLLKEQPGRLYCNWVASFAEACTDTFANRYVERGALVSDPADSGNCSNGHVVVKITHN